MPELLESEEGPQSERGVQSCCDRFVAAVGVMHCLGCWELNCGRLLKQMGWAAGWIGAG